MDFAEAIRVKAMLDVMEGGFLYHYRRICRWYSQKFYTPLPQVMELSEEEVLGAFFETQFEDMGKAARRNLAIEMTETPEERKVRKSEEDSKSDDAFLKRQEKEAKKEAKKLKKHLEEQAKAAAAKLAALADREIVTVKPEVKPKKKAKAPPLPHEDEEMVPPPPKKEAKYRDVSMVFDDLGDT